MAETMRSPQERVGAYYGDMLTGPSLLGNVLAYGYIYYAVGWRWFAIGLFIAFGIVPLLLWQRAAMDMQTEEENQRKEEN